MKTYIYNIQPELWIGRLFKTIEWKQIVLSLFIMLFLTLQMIQQSNQERAKQSQKSKQQSFDSHSHAYKLINGTYKIGPKIGEGSFGHVYYAQDQNQNQYAIKISDLKPQYTSIQNMEQIIKRLNEQDASMMACNSQYLMKCYGAFNDQKRNLKYIIMQLCDFGSLQDLIYLKGHLAEEQARIIIKQIFCGLSQMHRKGRIHRDIKSSNVCFHKDHSVLCDFGCSKQFLTEVERQNWRVTVKKNGTILGTILSKSPQMMSGQQYGFRTDIWAMGVLFYQMIAGIPPFFFHSDQSDATALEFIKDNINSIYEQEHIKNNLKRYGVLERGNYKISPAAKNFMKKLIVFDQNKRAGWKNLSVQQYLLKGCVKQGWEMVECILPLKDIDWKKFIQSIQVLFNEQDKINVPKLLQNYKALNIQIQPKDLTKKQQFKLYQKSKALNQAQQRSFDQIKILHFQIRRLNMLMNFRGYLGELQLKFNKLKCDKVGLMISKYCYLKLQKISKLVQDNKIGFFQNVGMEPLFNLISPIYMEDKSVFQRDHTGLINQIKSFSYDENKQKFYQNIKKQNMDVILQYIEEEARKLFRKIKENSQQIENIRFIEFFEYSKNILQASYQPNQNDRKSGCWRQWQNFGCIIEFLNQKNN